MDQPLTKDPHTGKLLEHSDELAERSRALGKNDVVRVDLIESLEAQSIEAIAHFERLKNDKLSAPEY